MPQKRSGNSNTNFRTQNKFINLNGKLNSNTNRVGIGTNESASLMILHKWKKKKKIQIKCMIIICKFDFIMWFSNPWCAVCYETL